MSEACQVAFVPHFTFFKVRSSCIPRHVLGLDLPFLFVFPVSCQI